MSVFSLNKAKKFLSIKIFKKRKALKYILFDKIYSAIVLNKKKIYENDFINDYHQKGYVNIDLNLNKEINELNKLLVLDKKINSPPFHFVIDNKVKTKITEIMKKIENNKLRYFKNYFNSNIFPAYICLRRNTHYTKKKLEQELFNDNFHNDGYLFTHFKIFINLSDINKEDGPMQIVSKKDVKKFLKEIGYKDRINYIDNKKEKISYLNTGKKGDCLVFDPTNCFHKAGMPQENHKRDYLIITYVCVPEKSFFSNELDKTDIFKYENNKILKLAKPTKLNQTAKLLLSYYRQKLV